MNARKLRVVESCPQPEPPPFRPIQYGFGGGHKVERLPHMPQPHEANIIARSQSRRTRNGVRAEPWSYEDSLRDLASANRPKRGVTVPEPHSPLPSGVRTATPSRSERVGRQSIHRSPCHCGDDAQRHWALVARDLIAAGRMHELTDDMRQAYDYEFGGVQEPEAPQVPEF